MVSEVGCYGSTEPCEYLQTDDDEYVVSGVENRWFQIEFDRGKNE